MNCFGGEALGFVLKDEDTIHLLYLVIILRISIDLLSNQIVKTE